MDFLRVLSDGAQPRSYTTRLVYPGRAAARKAGLAHFNGRSWVLTPAGRLALTSTPSAPPVLAEGGAS